MQINKKKTKFDIPFLLNTEKKNNKKTKGLIKIIEDTPNKLKSNFYNSNKKHNKNESVSKEKKNEMTLKDKIKYINIIDNINKNNNNNEKLLVEKNKNTSKKTKISKDNINNQSLEKSMEINFSKTKNNLYKSRANQNTIKNNYNYLNSSENSSKAKNTFLINKKYITRENSLSKNKTLLLDNISNIKYKIINEKNIPLNKKVNIIINYFEFKEPRFKRYFNSTKNCNNYSYNYKEYYYKTLKNNNELIKEVNSIKSLSINSNKNIIKKNTNTKKENPNYFTYTSRKQCKLKKLYNLKTYKKSIYSSDVKKVITSIFENDDDNDNVNNNMNKTIILIKSNWGNLNKINFISINLIDKSNEKVIINKANYDITKPYINKYNKGEIIKLIFYYDIKNKVKNIEIINGFDDSGIKSIIIENEEEEIVWRGIVPKKNIISNKPYIILLNNIKKNIKNKKKVKRTNFSFEKESPGSPVKNIISPSSNNNFNKTFINTIYKKRNNINNTFLKNSSYEKRNKIKLFINSNQNKINNKEINETYFNIKETYDRDNSDKNIFPNIVPHFSKLSNTNQKKLKLSNIDYQICDRIKIKLLNNYGNLKYIGLSGIEFYDENNSLIDINSNIINIKTNQKTINNKRKKLLNNLFNGKNDSTDEKDMFITKYDKYDEAFIEIDFKQKLKIKKIIIFNYNSNIFKDCGTKIISFIFYKNRKTEKIIKGIYLNQNIGEEGIEYKQILKYPFNDCHGINKYKILKKEIKYNLLHSIIIYNKEYDYYCPSYPCGFIIKLLMINNYGNNEYIGLEEIKLYDEQKNEIILSSEDEYIEENNIQKIFLLPENYVINPKNKPIFITKFKNEIKRIYIIFNNLIMLSKISIINYYKYEEIAVKDMKIFIDENLIFEGQLNKKLNEIFFSKIERNELKSKNKEQILSVNNNSSFKEQILENGAKILSFI